MMLVLSHRGYHKKVPENTLEAFEQAIALGVDGIETDVRLSADGLPVLFHDRLAPDGRPVASLARDQLNAVVGYPVPTLDSVLERWDNVIWNVEIKTPAALDATIPVLRKYQSSRRLLISSFWHDAIEAVRRHLEVPCGLLIAHRPASVDQLLALIASPGYGGANSAVRPDSIRAIVWYFEILEQGMLDASSEQGMQNFAWGMTSKEEHRQCAELGLDGIITDHPEFLLQYSQS
jgi:glycerophosphoryl diester phosphodiesterase